jgi:hypothetical protein
MPSLRILLDGDAAWTDLQQKKVHHVTDGLQVAMLVSGMQSGKHSVALRIDLQDGSAVLAELSLDLFKAAARAFEGREAFLAARGKGSV